jgi:hypothetical protein
MDAPLGRGRRWLFAMVLAGVALLSVELPLQLYYRITSGAWLFQRALPPIYEIDPVRCFRVIRDLDYVHHTNEFTIQLFTNAQSFRTDAQREPVAFEKPDDVYRVLFLGPSFAFGWGSDYEETYATRLASSLKVPGKRVELLNAGTPSQPPDQQACWFAQEGWRYQPDLIVQTTYGDHVALLPGGCPGRLRCPYIEGSRLFFERPTPARRAIVALKSLGVVFYGYYLYDRIGNARPAPGVGTGKELYAPELVAEADLAALVASFRDYVRFLRAHAGRDAQVAFVHLPLGFMVHPGDRLRWRHVVDVAPEQALARTRTELAALGDAGIPVVDTLGPLIASGERERQYFWLDIHLTPAGNATVSAAALPLLQRLVSASASPGAPATH